MKWADELNEREVACVWLSCWFLGPVPIRRIARPPTPQVSSRFDSRATHAHTLLPAASASVPFGFGLVRVRVRVGFSGLCLAEPGDSSLVPSPPQQRQVQAVVAKLAAAARNGAVVDAKEVKKGGVLFYSLSLPLPTSTRLAKKVFGITRKALDFNKGQLFRALLLFYGRRLVLLSFALA